MIQTELIKNFEGHAIYQITVKGRVDPIFMNRLNNLSVSHTNNNDQTYSTLSGEIADEEALNGLLNILFDHQFPVISLVKIGG